MLIGLRLYIKDMCEKLEQFSVLLTVYYKEKAEYFRRCLESLREQTIPADEWVIVKDGPLTPELDTVIFEYEQFNDTNIKIVSLEKNCGSGIASAAGLEVCSYDLVARMDSDDVAVNNRFELQLNEFRNDPMLDVCGGQILEFENDENTPIAERRVPLAHDDILKYHKLRSAVNNQTAMIRKDKIIAAGGYRDAPYMEDYMLYFDLLRTGARFKNIDSYLCKVRVNRDLLARRCGYDNYKKYKNAKKIVYQSGFISFWQYEKMNCIQFITCMMPKFLRKFIYFRLAHKKISNINE